MFSSPCPVTLSFIRSLLRGTDSEGLLLHECETDREGLLLHECETDSECETVFCPLDQQSRWSSMVNKDRNHKHNQCSDTLSYVTL